MPQLYLGSGGGEGGTSVHQTDFISKSKPQDSPARKGRHSHHRYPVCGQWCGEVIIKVSRGKGGDHPELLYSCGLGHGSPASSTPGCGGEANARPASGPDRVASRAALVKGPGPALSGWGSLAWRQGGGSGFKFRMTVSVAPRPEDK